MKSRQKWSWAPDRFGVDPFAQGEFRGFGQWNASAPFGERCPLWIAPETTPEASPEIKSQGIKVAAQSEPSQRCLLQSTGKQEGS
jgi:hypothetical protein